MSISNLDRPQLRFPLRRGGCVLRIYPDKMVMHFVSKPHQPIEKTYSHVENLYDLRLDGLIKLAEEFYLEVEHLITGESPNVPTEPELGP